MLKKNNQQSWYSSRVAKEKGEKTYLLELEMKQGTQLHSLLSNTITVAC